MPDPIRTTHELARALLARRDNDVSLVINDRDGDQVASSETDRGLRVEYSSHIDQVLIFGNCVLGQLIDEGFETHYVQTDIDPGIPSEKFKITHVRVDDIFNDVRHRLKRVRLRVVLERRLEDGEELTR